MRQPILGAAALLSMVLGAAAVEPAAADDAVCPSTEIVSTVLQRHFPGIKLTYINGADARRFVDAFNSSSASEFWPADEVLIARNPKTPDRARIGFFKDGCLLALVARSLWSVDSLQRSLNVDQDI
jgi:hypothetical protein